MLQFIDIQMGAGRVCLKREKCVTNWKHVKFILVILENCGRSFWHEISVSTLKMYEVVLITNFLRKKKRVCLAQEWNNSSWQWHLGSHNMVKVSCKAMNFLQILYRMSEKYNFWLHFQPDDIEMKLWKELVLSVWYAEYGG